MRAWTTEQQSAITLPPSLLVSAAAGAGKTAVLTERIARLVLLGGDVDRMLVVTFTEAATREMRARIEQRLTDAAHAADGPALAQRLQAQARLAGGRGGGSGSVSTLHGFCLYLLRRNFHQLGLDPAFAIADEAEGKMLFAEALADVAADQCEAGNRPYLNLLHALGSEARLFELASTLYGFLMAQTEPFAWLTAAASAYDLTKEALGCHPIMGAVLDRLRSRAGACVALLQEARSLTPPGFTKVLSLLDDDLSKIRGVLARKDYEAAAATLLTVSMARFQGWPKEEEQERRELVKGLRDKARKALNELRERVLPLDEAVALQNRVSPYVRALCDFVRAVASAYEARKAANSLVDFSDMEHLALRALQNDAVATSLQARFDHIFVDEYQDSSRIQEALLSRISRGGRNLFLVGDVKQSIYRFRMAEPGLFLEKLKTFTGAPGAPGRQVHLNQNFRSTPAVLRAVNELFSRVMTKETGELAYDENAALYPPPGAMDTPLSGCELRLVERAGARDGDEDLTDAQAEALVAARRIRELMETQLYTPRGAQKPRKLRFEDFTVLLRSHRQAAEIWAATLAAEGIPAYAQLTGGYFEAVEVQVFLNLLRVIDNRRQDIPLWSVLRGVFGFTAEELIALRTVAPQGETCFDCLRLASGENTPLGRRAAALLFRLAAYDRESHLLPLPDFIAKLLDDTEYYLCVGALPGGPQRQANLAAMLERARAMRGAPNLWGFLRFMDQAASTADLGRAQPGAADVVRILSMHAAKGLEYPVVILGGLGKGFHQGVKREPLQCDGDLGLGLSIADPVSRVRLTPLIYEALQDRRWRQQLAEEMRILYVGMTRARERLILMGCLTDAAERLADAAPLTQGAVTAGKSYLDWLMPVAKETEPVITTFLHARRESPAVTPPPAATQNGPDEEALYQALCERLCFRYPYLDAAFVPSKVSVSDLGRTAPEASLLPAPKFARPEGALSAAERGTAAHLFLSRLALSACPATGVLAWLKAERDRLLQENKISKAQAAALYLPAIAGFLESGLGRRLLSAARVERELEFCLEVPANELMNEPTEEPVLLQGVLDCCFLEHNEWILIDYKTDYIASDSEIPGKAAHHAPQVALYAKALKTLTGLPVRERFVIFLNAGAAVSV